MTTEPEDKLHRAINKFGYGAININSVIGAATIRSALDGADVVGIFDGFRWLMQGNDQHVLPLTIQDVSRIQSNSGSCTFTMKK